MSNELLIILGNQLFPLDNIRKSGCNNVFMAEDMELCTYVKHHKQKIAFFLTAMRNYRDELISNEIIKKFNLMGRLIKGHEKNQIIFSQFENGKVSKEIKFY